MTFTIEPILTEGTDEMVILEDGWTALTCDNSRAAQCEHTVLITEEGVEVLTAQLTFNFSNLPQKFEYTITINKAVMLRQKT